MGLTSTESSYCPKCNIVREFLMSVPYLCNQCYSIAFYQKDNKHYCWYCDNDKFIGLKPEEINEKRIFEEEGYKLSTTNFEEKKCKHNNLKNIRHNETVFKFECNDCGHIEYIFIPKWIQEKNNITDDIKVYLNY